MTTSPSRANATTGFQRPCLRCQRLLPFPRLALLFCPGSPSLPLSFCPLLLKGRALRVKDGPRPPMNRSLTETDPRISIVIPIYNEQGILHSAVVDLRER